MGMIIRFATLEDTATIAEFNRLMAEETEHRQLDTPTLLKGVEAVIQDPAKGTYYVAEIDGQPAGQLLITYEWSDWRNGTFWWIQSVYVPKEFRRRGVFKALFEHVRSLASGHRGVCGIRLYVEEENARAQSTYSALGMRRTPYEIFEIDFVLK